MPITAVSQGVYVLDCTLKVSAPQPQNFWNVPTTFDLVFFSLNNDFQMKKGYAETSVWFVHVTDCYCSGKKNLNKFFLTAKLPVVQSHPILMGWLWRTLVVFVWQKRMQNEPVVFAFGKERL